MKSSKKVLREIYRKRKRDAVCALGLCAYHHGETVVDRLRVENRLQNLRGNHVLGDHTRSVQLRRVGV